MNPAARRVQRIYLTLLLGNTLAASFIWGINTLFLLDAGLSNFEAFAANAFFTVGMVIFEIPTGVVADTAGRKLSYLLGTVTLSVTTGLYWMLWLWQASFVWWAIVSVLLGLLFLYAFFVMRDLGFTPDRGAGPLKATRNVLNQSIEHGLTKRSVRYVILSAPFVSGVAFYAFYALQPYLLELYGDPSAYSIAGLAAAVLSLSQVAGGVVAPRIRGPFARRTTVVVGASLTGIAALVVLGLTSLFWLAVVFLVVWGFVGSAASPVRQAYLNDMIPSKQRATVLSFDSLFGSLGGVFIQPALGRSADLWGYGTSLVIGGTIQLIAVPLLFASRRRRDPADTHGNRS